MPNILTAAQAANATRVASNDSRLTDLLPQVDEFIKRATGRDWTQDATINAVAISAATMLTVAWFDNPSMMGDEAVLAFGLTNALNQLEAEALKYRIYQFTGSNGTGSIQIEGARLGDEVIALVGVYGASGNQAASFESDISVADAIQQSSASDLSENLYVVTLKHPSDDILA